MSVLRELECDLGPLQRRCAMLIGGTLSDTEQVSLQ